VFIRQAISNVQETHDQQARRANGLTEQQMAMSRDAELEAPLDKKGPAQGALDALVAACVSTRCLHG
jgi:hypothetical protein